MLIDGRIMEFMSVDEVVDGLKESKTVIIPMGVIEQHGFHLPLNVDVFNCYEIAKRTAAKSGCFVAPPINYSYSGGEVAGTFNIHPSTLSLYLNDIMKSLVVMGFKNIIVLLGHGGTENMVATKVAIDMFMRLNPDIKDIVFAFMPFTVLSKYTAEAFKEKDFHAGYFETSLMMYWHPELVNMSKVAVDTDKLMELFRKDPDNYQVETKLVEHEYVVPYIKQHPEMKVGVMGFPERANRELGEKVCNDAVARTVEFIKKVETDRLK